MFIELHKIVGIGYRDRDQYSDTDEPGENREPDVRTTEFSCNTGSIRSWNRRKNGDKPGTYIKFNDGAGISVTETYEQVSELVRGAGFN